MKQRRGFTLVEISVAIAVVGLLASIALPSFSSARRHCLDRAKQINVRLVNNMVEEWAMDTMQMDCALIDAVITNYIKGGIEQLSVGNSHVGLTNITGRTVDHEFTVGDLY